ncbi:MAG TPA: arylesterase [Stellaceae bacterium]|nr:arylesterase [Stellaceae bacterium]
MWRNLVNPVYALLLGLGLSAGLGEPAHAATRIVALGDSLTSGYGLPLEQSFPERLQTWLQARGFDAQIVNAGVSGDTTAGGLRRLDWALSEPADAVLVELGANDALRGLDPEAAYDNLDRILTRLEARKLKVLLLGMKGVENWGDDYARKFDAIYPRLAEKHHVLLYPFFLDGVALDPALNQPDGLHPNPAGVDVIVNRVGPYVLRLLDAAPGGKG